MSTGKPDWFPWMTQNPNDHTNVKPAPFTVKPSPEEEAISEELRKARREADYQREVEAFKKANNITAIPLLDEPSIQEIAEFILPTMITLSESFESNKTVALQYAIDRAFDYAEAFVQKCKERSEKANAPVQNT